MNSLNQPSISKEVINSLLKKARFNDQGLIPAIAQQHDSGEVLMMAWMSADAIRETLNSGRVCYFSRSRNALWKKGETSGQVQKLIAMRLDCDADCLLVLVDQTGVACHTGRRNCFFHEVRPDGLIINSDVEISPQDLYKNK